MTEAYPPQLAAVKLERMADSELLSKASSISTVDVGNDQKSTSAGANGSSIASTPEPLDHPSVSKESTSSPRTASNDSKFVTLREDTAPTTTEGGPALKRKLSLPPIEHVLKNIDAYQNEQKLQDSQLLLDFKERTNSIYELENGDESVNTDASTVATSEDSAKPHEPKMATFNAQMDIIFKSEDPLTPTSGKLASLPPFNTTTGGTMSVLNIGPDLTKSNTPASEQTSRHSSVDSQDSHSGGSTPTSARDSRKRTNLPRETIEILNEWVLNNLDNPYPNHTQKRILLEKTGLSNVQLSNWFINKRRRRIFSNLSGNQGQPIKKKRLIDRL